MLINLKVERTLRLQSWWHSQFFPLSLLNFILNLVREDFGSALANKLQMVVIFFFLFFPVYLTKEQENMPEIRAS